MKFKDLLDDNIKRHRRQLPGNIQKLFEMRDKRGLE